MTQINRTHLDQLENQSIFIFREAYHTFKNIAMPWSMGKDSNVLIWLARKSFFGKVPFPVLHIDTTYEFPEMLEFREWAAKHYKLAARKQDQRNIPDARCAISYFRNNEKPLAERHVVALAEGG